MIEIKEYRGQIRNWRMLCEKLGVACDLTRQEREEQILIRAYETWGYDLPQHLDGMFAAALWDEERQELFCMRDPFGTKPFYYYQTIEGRLLYGHSLQSFMKDPGFIKRLNEKALQLYLNMTYIAGEDTFFAGVKKLMPGHYLIWREGRLTVQCYWKPKFCPEEGRTLQEWADEIHDTLEQVMRETKEEDEQAEVFLSGGVDSSYLLAMSDAAVSDSCGYEEKEYDEAELAKQIAEALGRKNEKCLVTPQAYFAAVPYVMKQMEQPLGDASAVVFAIACRQVGKRARLCYSGEGADEFFGGYHIYQKAEEYGERLESFYVGNTNIMREEEKREILKRYDESVQPLQLMQEIYADTKGLDPLTRMMMIDIRLWLEGDIYLNIDKMSAAAGLEIRMPFTNMKFLEIASRMPSKYKIAAGQNKVAFRTAAAKVLPEETAFRKKLGFAVPIQDWLADDRYNQDVKQKLQGPLAERFFQPAPLTALLEDFLNGNRQSWRKIWTIYTFLVWYEEYFVKW
ncbi:MAG: asparagine synthase (glutamine-hydrolyzing) [Lachnospiraceae bacterium]|jgi:asparagine synthase (glutamine-hydrolysing)|nr:asparagine synthase (glutamine-hydrolyzing) [Lachnospiraceae bacterium]